MSGFVETQMDDADRAGVDYSLANPTCPECGYRSHAGRCHFVHQDADWAGGKLIPCYCKHKREPAS